LKSFGQQDLVVFVLKIARPGFGFLAESGQKSLKVGIHSEGGRQKNFQGGQRKKDRKIAKEIEK